MKLNFKLIFTCCLSLSLVAGVAQNSSTRKIPTAKVKNLKGSDVNTSDFQNDGKPMVISFWATWCKPCINELSAIAEDYETWQEETGVKLIAISIDDSRNVAKIGPLINTKGWEYEVYSDQNGDFKRALNVNNVPHTFLIDGEGNIVWQHNAYAPGDEKELFNKIKALSAGKSIEDEVEESAE